MKAARLTLVGVREGWAPAFVRAIYTANFAEQKDISDDAVLAAALRAVGANVDAATAVANSSENKSALKAQTEDAAARGIFGAPSFTVGGELFWGNDRLEDAIDWAKKVNA